MMMMMSRTHGCCLYCVNNVTGCNNGNTDATNPAAGAAAAARWCCCSSCCAIGMLVAAGAGVDVDAISSPFIIIIIIIITDDSDESCKHIDHQWSQSIYCCVWFLVVPIETVTIVVYTAVALFACLVCPPHTQRLT